MLALGNIPYIRLHLQRACGRNHSAGSTRPSTGLVDGPRVPLQPLAATQREVPPPVRGIQRQRSAAKAARETAKRNEKDLCQYREHKRNGCERGSTISKTMWHTMEKLLEDLHISSTAVYV